MEQLNIFDFLASTPAIEIQLPEEFDLKRYMNEPLLELEPDGEPPCYSCALAVKRGPFRLCSTSGSGYKHIGIWGPCELRQGFEAIKDTAAERKNK